VVVKTVYTIAEAEADFEVLLERVSQGEEIVLLKDGVPVAKMVVYEQDGPEASELA